MEYEYYIREGLAILAAITALTGAYFKGHIQKKGWIFSGISSILWMAFAVMVQSPAVFCINILNILLAIRGYFIWRQQLEVERNA